MFRPSAREMTAPWGILAQLCMIAIAYTAAAIAAGTFATFAILNVGLNEVSGDWEHLAQALFVGSTTTLAAAVNAFWPAAIAIAITEGFRLRGVVAYLVAGCAVGLLAAAPLSALISGAPMPPLDMGLLQLAVACGAVGGFVYWLIAGRTAGMWLELRWFDGRR